MSDYLEPFLCLYAYVFSLCCPFYGLCSDTGYLPGYICSCTLHAFQTFALVLLIVHSRSADPYCGDHLLYCTIHRYTFLKWNDNTLLYLACGPPAVVSLLPLWEHRDTTARLAPHALHRCHRYNHASCLRTTARPGPSHSPTVTASFNDGPSNPVYVNTLGFEFNPLPYLGAEYQPSSYLFPKTSLNLPRGLNTAALASSAGFRA